MNNSSSNSTNEQEEQEPYPLVVTSESHQDATDSMEDQLPREAQHKMSHHSRSSRRNQHQHQHRHHHQPMPMTMPMPMIMSSERTDSAMADAYSNCLADVALHLARKHCKADVSADGDSSVTQEAGNSDATMKHHRHRKSSESSDASAGSGSEHLVTANTATGEGSTQTGTTTTATSSGDDDHDSSGANRSAGGTISTVGGGASSSGNNSSDPQLDQKQDQRARPHRGSSQRHHHHHHSHRHHRQRTLDFTSLRGGNNDDGSALQVPGDDGSDRMTGGPATVIAASHMPPPSSDSSSSGGSGGEGDGLLEPYREPGYHAIRRTFSRIPKRGAAAAMAKKKKQQKALLKGSLDTACSSSSSSEEQAGKRYIKGKHGFPSTTSTHHDGSIHAKKQKMVQANPPDPDRMFKSPSLDSLDANGSSSGSGSGTEGGYMGSADPKENESTSSDESIHQTSKKKKFGGLTSESIEVGAPLPKDDDDLSEDLTSSEIADFSSGTTSENGEDSEDEEVGGGGGDYTISTYHQSAPPYFSYPNEDEGGSSEDRYEESYIHTKQQVPQVQQQHQYVLEATTRKRKAVIEDGQDVVQSNSRSRPIVRFDSAAEALFFKRLPHSPILTLGSDIMAHVLTFLQPPIILDVLTMPLSKEWRDNFTSQPELWRVLCLVEPFKADIRDSDDDDAESDENTASSSDSFCSLRASSPTDRNAPGRRLLGRYRILYTSFVRCMKYLSQIREDALNGRPPSFIDYGIAGSNAVQQQNLVGNNRNLQNFLARARGVASSSKRMDGAISSASSCISASSQEPQQVSANVAALPLHDTKKRKRSKSKSKKQKQVKTGPSMLTGRLLGPSTTGQPGSLDLPWSCAIYSIVNWMVSFSDVEGIQTLCLKVLPFLLENEQQRLTAQRAGLTDVVLRAMVLFPGSVQLHIAAFHTIVLLARPLGGREGMLFHSSMTLSGILCGENSQHPKSGIAVMVDSMQRFEDSAVLQAMSCWALVNIALAPTQKSVLVKLGGIQAITNAMLRHPFSAEVQFRALFALINLVIPSVGLNTENPENAAIEEQLGNINDTTEKEILDELVGEIAGLVVRAMQNFCSSEAILNRACLVLHNLSLTQEYHSTLLWTPNCYQMLEWCLANYRNDQVLQQSATGTLHRLQVTLSNNDGLRRKFTAELQSQQQVSLELAHREALLLHQRHEELQRTEQQK